MPASVPAAAAAAAAAAATNPSVPSAAGTAGAGTGAGATSAMPVRAWFAWSTRVDHCAARAAHGATDQRAERVSGEL